MAAEHVGSGGENDRQAAIDHVTNLIIDLELEKQTAGLDPDSEQAAIQQRTIDQLLADLDPEDHIKVEAQVAEELDDELADARDIQANHPVSRAIRRLNELEKEDEQ